MNKKQKNTRRKRLKYAVGEGQKAYRRGKTSKLRRAKNLLIGKNATGFAGRVGLLGVAGAGVGAYKLGGNAVRAGSNLEKATEAFKKTAQNVEQTTANARNSSTTVNNGVQNTAGFFQNIKKKANKAAAKGKNAANKARGFADRKAQEGIAARRKRLGFSNNIDNLTFMSRNNEYANFSEEQLEDALEAAFEEIEDQYQNGELTDEEADELEADLEDEYEEILDELDYEDEDEEFEASVYDGELANFSAATDLGERIMEYVVETDPVDPEETILDLAYSLQLVDEEGYQLEGADAIEGVLGLMTGEVLPDESLLSGLAEYFELDEEEVDEIVDLTEDQLDAEGYVEAEYDDDDDEYYEDEAEYDEGYVGELEEDIEDLESELDEVGELAEQAFSRIENMEANFAIAQENTEISSEFNQLEQEAYSLVESGQMPPAVFEENYGDFTDKETQLAAFSQVCDSKGVDFSAELYRLDGINETYADMEPNINFSQMSYSDPNSQDYEVDDATIAQAVRNVRGRTYGQDFGKPIDFGQPAQQVVDPRVESAPQAVGTYGGNIQSIGQHSRAL